MDYAMKKGVSLSTLRRYIKANKIRFKTEQGRYLIWDEDASSPESDAIPEGRPSVGIHVGSRRESMASSSADARKIEELELKLRRAQEEIAELKMLVALYEEQLFQKPSLQI